MSLLKSLKSVAIALTLVFSIAQVPSSAMASSTVSSQKIVFTMSHGTDNLANAFMAIGMAKMFAEKGHDVKVFLNLEAVRIADKRQPLDLKFGKREGNYQATFDAFVAAGGTFVVCPKCAAVAGVTKENLRKGASMGNPNVVSTMILEADKVIGY